MPRLQPLDSPLRFGIFLPPMHKTGINPTLALQRDLELMEHLDRLGYAEAWIGEHHSAGSELIASPEVFIAAASHSIRRRERIATLASSTASVNGPEYSKLEPGVGPPLTPASH